VNLHADHYFHIGAAHLGSGKPCQDYALSLADGQLACAVVSDGCSSGRHTDIGSRVLTLSTVQAIRDHARASGGALATAVVSITSRQQQILSVTRVMLGLTRDDMLATCGYVYLTQHGGFVHVQGDGVVAHKYRDGRIKMSRYEWADNTPFYPSYGDGSINSFIAAHGGDLEAMRLERCTVIQNPDGSEYSREERAFSLRDGLEGVIEEIVAEELSGLEFVAVFSDGITQIGGTTGGGEPLDWTTAVRDFLAFKAMGGEFAKRRMIRGIKQLQQVGLSPIDDISYAVVRIEPEEGEEVRAEP